MRSINSATLLAIWIGGFALTILVSTLPVATGLIPLSQGGIAVIALLALLLVAALLLYRFRSHFGPVRVLVFLGIVVLSTLLLTGFARILGNAWFDAVFDSLLWSWAFGAIAGIRRTAKDRGPDPSHAA
jgi:hypothetical protein